MPHTALILLALGDGDYLGHGCPSALVQFNHRPVLLDCLDLVLHEVGLQQVALVVPEAVEAEFRAAVPARDWPTVRIVTTTGDRRAAIHDALRTLPNSTRVLVHDSERALAPPALFEAVMLALEEGADAAAPGLEVTDSVKSCVRDDGGDDALSNVERSIMRALQTPVAFTRTTLEAVLATPLPSPTERRPTGPTFNEIRTAGALGARVDIVQGNFLASSIDGPIDLWRAQIILGLARRARTAHLSPELLRRGAHQHAD
ncbi:2-C-methyl-D-erythritol 4-phosphate cytidylyltransferase [Micrococcales bacterium 31B]|nr:2-C-methyl-D-erythritol 4-phosphate cytidylyltransferase [Micrococcales bacterium 31B]